MLFNGNMLNSFNDNYQELSKIGEGSFSEVFKVEDIKTKGFFAAKRLRKTFESLEEVEEYSELKIFKKLDFHPNVINLCNYVFEADKGVLTLIFNLMDMSLYDFVKDRKRKLPESKCQNYIYQLLHAVNFLHSNGIFHRDIKPENIFIKIDSTLKKSNPLIAELIQLGDLGSVSESKRPFPRSEYISTRWYRAPECLLTNGYYGSKMDIWAIGCCFYEMLTLQPLFPGENEIDQLYKIHEILGSPTKTLLARFKHRSMHIDFPRKSPVSFYHLVPKLSNYGVDALKRMLIYHPDNRHNAKRLLEHIYFDELKYKMPFNALNNRLILSSKSDCSTPTLMQKSSRHHMRRGKSNLSDASSSINDIASKHEKSFKTIEMRLNKQLERNWNMPLCPLKHYILNNMKTVVNNQRNAISLNSSLDSLHGFH